MSKDHFYFSRNDRIVALVLLCIIVVSKVALISFPGKGYVQDAEPDSIQTVNETVKTVEKSKERFVSRKDSIPRITTQSYRFSQEKRKETNKNFSADTVRTRRYPYKQRPVSPLDLNAVDSLALVSLPGIGPYYSSRILNYREQLGGYAFVSQLMEINGLPDSLMKWFVVTDTVPLRQIRVNSETLTGLRKHPYINFYQARAVVELRRERGKIKGPEQLSLVEEFTDQDLIRLNPYLDFR